MPWFQQKKTYAIAVFAVILLLFKQYMNGPTCNSKSRLDGKVAVITGANSGIGRATALDFFIRGATVYMACRSVKKGQIVIKEIQQSTRGNTKQGHLVVLELNLASLTSVRKFVEDFKSRERRLDILMNNAGVMYIDYNKTEDGFEETFGVNYLGHFLLTKLLLGPLKTAAPSRIVTITSLVHQYGQLHFDDLMGEYNYNSAIAYCQSKYALVVFSKELGRRLHGTGVTTYSVHPGVILTEIQRNIFLFQIPILREICTALTWPFFKDLYYGSQTQICCAVSEEFAAQTGKYYSDVAMAKAAETTDDKDIANKLWDVSEKLVGVQISLLKPADSDRV